ncbi:MAG TPA: hypothetical protein VNO33_03125 [Kofleriaceae bacterium]|nr:hypothetical protein [Kofleriaceae bacterium]
MGRPRNRPYKRTWKNLLINKQYQLRFTLFMVVLSAMLMSLLGWWVMSEADTSTTTAVNNALTVCRGMTGSAVDRPRAPAPTPAPAPAQRDEPRQRRRPVVTIDDSGMRNLPPAAAAPAAASGPSREEIAAYRKCQATIPARVKRIEDRLRLTFRLLVGIGALITIALLLYGIKMTHKVAGPLHKVSLYMGKLRQGQYDMVYNLRKGDHLIDFYEHFKKAHAGMRALQEEDVALLRSLLGAADQAELASRSPELAVAVAELRTMLDEKEKSLV